MPGDRLKVVPATRARRKKADTAVVAQFPGKTRAGEDVRTEKIRQVTEALDHGTFVIDSDKIAESMLAKKPEGLP